jgi:hypothetical protein
MFPRHKLIFKNTSVVGILTPLYILVLTKITINLMNNLLSRKLPAKFPIYLQIPHFLRKNLAMAADSRVLREVSATDHTQ